MKNNTLAAGYVLLVFTFCSMFSLPLVHGQNVAMHFDGNNDYLSESPTSISGYDLVIEGWFNTSSISNNPTCNGQEGELLWHLGDQLDEFLMLGECNGDLFIYQKNSATVVYLPSVTTGAIRGGWKHISTYIKRVSGSNTLLDIEVYLDCTLVITGQIDVWNYNELNIGGIPPSFNGNYKNYFGEVDDFKVYGKWIDPNIICDAKRCIPEVPNNIAAIIYYSFDEGDPGNDNRTRSDVMDFALRGADATINNFDLQGAISNYVKSTSPLFQRTDLYCPIITSVPFQMDTLTQICSGEPVHLCMTDTADMFLAAAPPNMVELNWVYTTDQGSRKTYSVIDTLLLDLTCGVSPASSFVIDCSSNALGYEDWQVRGEFKFKQGLDSCYHRTKAIPLRICCGLDSLEISGTTNQAMDLLCDMDTIDFSIDLLPNYPFLTNAASGVTIDWFFNGVALGQFANQTSFNYNNIIVDVAAGACFNAKIDFPVCGKSADIDLCFPIDPRPVCGTIDTLMMPTAMRQISASPKVYEICPGNDAALKIDQPFSNCIPTWQFSFNGTAWVDMGTSNSQQNTNIIPTSLWPGTNIFYRIECRPINDPSGCEPCYSDTLEIRLPAPLVAGSVTGAAMFCKGDMTTLTHNGHDPSLNNQWYCNGLPVGSGGRTLAATETGCYWVESSDSCQAIETSRFCTMACEVVASISCPDVCPRPGVAITLSACDSFDTCNKALTYTWQVTGSNAPTINGCSITHIPDPGGTTYTVTVTNAIGCTDTATVTIIPCAQ